MASKSLRRTWGMGENEWEISERVTEHERLLTLGNEQGILEGEGDGEMGGLGDRH